MSVPSLIRLVLLAAIWGASFMLLRVTAPVFGTVWVIGLRLVIAAGFLAAVATLLCRPPPARAHAWHFLTVGAVNSLIPFLLFAQAAQTLSASMLSILNATAPSWAAALGTVWLRTPLTRSVGVGLLLGLLGVALLVGGNATATPEGWAGAAGLAVLAPACYGLATTLAKRSPAPVVPFDNAHGSMWGAALLSLPLLMFNPVPGDAIAPDWAALAALGMVCTGAAYLLYFRLIQDAGPTAALSVTFLIPVFGVLWGVFLLGETVGWHTFVGGGTVLLGTALSTGVLFLPGDPARSAN